MRNHEQPFAWTTEDSEDEIGIYNVDTIEEAAEAIMGLYSAAELATQFESALEGFDQEGVERPLLDTVPGVVEILQLCPEPSVWAVPQDLWDIEGDWPQERIIVLDGLDARPNEGYVKVVWWSTEVDR